MPLKQTVKFGCPLRENKTNNLSIHKRGCFFDGKLGFIYELRLSTNSRLPLSRGLPRKRVEESFQRKVTLNIYLSLRLLTALKSRQNSPPSTEGGKSLHIQTARQIKI